MKEKINKLLNKYHVRELYKKYRSVILYLIFGGITTLINIGVYYVMSIVLALDTSPATVIAWLMAVIAAYLTNRKWVFDSHESTFMGIAREFAYFMLCRVASGLLDLGIMYVFVDVLFCSEMLMKVLSNIIVVIMNYVTSKLIIFKKAKTDHSVGIGSGTSDADRESAKIEGDRLAAPPKTAGSESGSSGKK